MATYTLTINGTERQVQFGSLDMRRTISGISTLTCRIQSPDASYRPQPDDEVLLYEDDGSSPPPVMFGGIVRTCREQAMVGWGAPIVTEIDCGDFSVLAQRRLVSQTLAAGTLKSQLMTVVSLLATLGITLHASQVDGPSMEPYAFDVVPANEVLDTLAGTARMVWRIDADKVLRVFEPGDESAPWHLTETNRSEHQIIGDIIVEHSRAEGYADRIIVKAGSGTALQTETITGDGSATSWPLDLPADQSYWPGQITRRAPIATSNATGEVITSTVAHGLVSGDRVTIAGHSGSTPDINGDHTVTVLSSTTFSIPVNITAGGTGGEWSQRVPVGPYEPQYGALSLWALQWDRLTNTIYQRTGATPLTNGLQLSLTYNAQYPFEVVVTGSPEGTIDKVLYAPNAFTKAAAIAAGEAELARSSATVSRVEYTTKDHGLTPGMSQSLVESYRQLNQSCFIVEIASHDDELDRLTHKVSLISSLEYVPGWRQVYQNGGTITVASVDTGVSDDIADAADLGRVQFKSVAIYHTALLALGTTPVTVVPSTGAGYVNVPLHASAFTAFSTGYGQAARVRLRYQGHATQLAISNVFVSQESPDPYMALCVANSAGFAMSGGENKDLVVEWDNAISSGGASDNVMICTVAYYTAQVSELL